MENRKVEQTVTKEDIKCLVERVILKKKYFFIDKFNEYDPNFELNKVKNPFLRFIKQYRDVIELLVSFFCLVIGILAICIVAFYLTVIFTDYFVYAISASVKFYTPLIMSVLLVVYYLYFKVYQRKIDNIGKWTYIDDYDLYDGLELHRDILGTRTPDPFSQHSFYRASLIHDMFNDSPTFGIIYVHLASGEEISLYIRSV